MENYHVRYAPLSARFEIVRMRKGKKADIVLSRRDAQAEVMNAFVEMMMDGFGHADRVTLDFTLGDRKYKATLEARSDG